MFTKLSSYLKKNIWLVPVLSALALRLYDLTSSSIWHDEGYTMWLIRYGFIDIVKRTARDVHPPAYYLIAKVWVSIFGTSVISIRFLSLLFSVGIVFVVYLIVKKIWSEQGAFWASLLVAFSPFMIRFGQEARMYGVVAFFTTLAAYFFIKYLKDKNEGLNLAFFTASMIVAMYTQYYAFFVIISLWAIYAVLTPELWQFHWLKAIKEKNGVFDWKWWLANLSLLVLYGPWFPVVYRQVTRVNTSYWIQAAWITIRTIPNNILQFVTYTHFDQIYYWNKFGVVVYWLISLFAILIGLVLFLKKDKWKTALALYIYGLLPMLLVFAVSKLKTPIYQDRYFPFSAIALFVIWGIAISMIKNKTIRVITGSALLIVLLAGNLIMHTSIFHGMRQLKDTVETNKKPADVVLSGELYTFLDGSYYFGYGNIKFISGPVDGYGESSLFYDQQNQYLVPKDKVKDLGNRIWVIGKTGDKDYYNPNFWQGWTAKTYFEENNSDALKAVLYTRD